ncbi:hypothetical protein [Mesorhizobium sp. B1-1-8]|nr:hypothetical protein [Mesorhizobium sp. B1-1-8]
MAAMRRKQATRLARRGAAIVAQHFPPVVQHKLMPHCTNRLEL